MLPTKSLLFGALPRASFIANVRVSPMIEIRHSLFSKPYTTCFFLSSVVFAAGLFLLSDWRTNWRVGEHALSTPATLSSAFCQPVSAVGVRRSDVFHSKPIVNYVYQVNGQSLIGTMYARYPDAAEDNGKACAIRVANLQSTAHTAWYLVGDPRQSWLVDDIPHPLFSYIAFVVAMLLLACGIRLRVRS